MADVFLAVDTGPAGLGFSKLVVIKRLREDLSQDPDFVAMLVDEARIAARLNHPNVVQTIEIGEADGQYFLAMEYLDGQPLRRIANRANASGGLPHRLHFAAIADVLCGLHHAHQLTDYDGGPLHIVHRDVTPHNVFVTYDGQVKVVDFGIAKAVGRASETRHGMIKGKAPYMAPEQARAGPVDRRADIYSVGVMLWEAATRKRMWAHAIDEGEIIRSLIRGKVPASPRSVDPTVPEAIDAMCVRALAINPEERYATAAEFEAELSTFLEQSANRASARELGRYVAELFAETRLESRKIIESQLTQLIAPNVASFKTVSFPPPSLTPSRSVQIAMASVSQRAPKIIVSDPPPPPAAPDPALGPGTDLPSTRRAQTSPRTIGIAVLGFAALGLAVWGVETQGRDPAEAGQPGAARTDLAPSGALASPAEIALTLRASPVEARFSIDDGPSLPNPFVGHEPKDGAQHRVTVAAPGYTTLHQVISFDDDVALQLSLAIDPLADAGHGAVHPIRRR